jgi:predicted anti-sigma-YlaC factor YlaD
MNVDCDQLRDLLCDYVGGELCSERCATIEAHISNCRPCADFLVEYNFIIRVGKCLHHQPVPDSLMERLKRAMGNDCTGPA